LLTHRRDEPAGGFMELRCGSGVHPIYEQGEPVVPPKEKVFYQSGDVIVTSSRLILPSQSFALASVSSVHRTSSKSSWIPAAAVLVFGLLFVITGSIGKIGGSLAFGLLLLGGGGWMFIRRKTSHHLVVVSDGKRKRVHSDPNRHLIEAVIVAVGEAIAFHAEPLDEPGKELESTRARLSNRPAGASIDFPVPVLSDNRPADDIIALEGQLLGKQAMGPSIRAGL
jgi:hypothetical protein